VVKEGRGYRVGLFADGETGTAALVVIAGLVGGGVAWLWKSLSDARAQRRKEGQEDEETALSRMEKLLKRGDEERVLLREDCRKAEQHFEEEIGDLRAKLRTAELTAERAVAWIQHLEAALDRAKLPYRHWEDVVGNGGPYALPQSKSPEPKPPGPEPGRG
jgi:hypothetical protein